MVRCTAIVLRQHRAKATDTGYCSPLLFRRAMTCMNVGFGVRAWQPQQIDSISMEYHNLLKEIRLSYFRNIIKSRSEYFEYGIIHFPRNQPRTTLGFAWKQTAVQGKCCGTAIPASPFPLGQGSPARLPQCPQLFPPLSACLGQSSHQLFPHPLHGRALIAPAHAGVTHLFSEPGTLHWPQQAPKLSADKHIGRANAQH